MAALMNNLFLYDYLYGVIGTVILGLVFLTLGIVGYRFMNKKD